MPVSEVFEVQSDGFNRAVAGEGTKRDTPIGKSTTVLLPPQERGIGHSEQVSCGSVEGHANETPISNGELVATVRPSVGRALQATASEYQASPAGRIAEAASHLRVALVQSHPDDDQIILGHVREALKLLEGK